MDFWTSEWPNSVICKEWSTHKEEWTRYHSTRTTLCKTKTPGDPQHNPTKRLQPTWEGKQERTLLSGGNGVVRPSPNKGTVLSLLCSHPCTFPTLTLLQRRWGKVISFVQSSDSDQIFHPFVWDGTLPFLTFQWNVLYVTIPFPTS